MDSDTHMCMCLAILTEDNHLARKNAATCFGGWQGPPVLPGWRCQYFFVSNYMRGGFAFWRVRPPPRLPCAQGLLMHKFESRVQSEETTLYFLILPV